MATFADLLASARLPEAGVEICLAGHLQLEYEELEGELALADEADDRDDGFAGASGGRARKVAEKITALEAQMRDQSHVFKFRAISRQDYRNLVEAHPPRDDNRDDEAFGANMSTFPAAILARCCIDPVMTEDDVRQLSEVLSEGQLMALFSCVTGINRIRLDVPKSAAASAILARQGPKSPQPAPGASLANGSLAGNPAG